MSMTIELAPNQEAKIIRNAAAHGVAPLTYAQRLLDEALEREDERERSEQHEKNQRAIAMLQGWIDEDASFSFNAQRLEDCIDWIHEQTELEFGK